MRKKIGIISLLTLISIIVIIPNSYGALASKPTTATDGSNVLVNKSVSDSYALCQQMKANGESLYGSTVNPHLATNKDWGAVSYLSHSVYGTNTAGGNRGIQITINGVNYYSTTGNASGVMNWGVNPNKTLNTQNTGILKAYMDLTNKTNNYVTELVTAANNNSKYVEVIDTKSNGFNERTDGMALSETMNYSFIAPWNTAYQDTNYPIVIRNGLFGFSIGYVYNSAGRVGQRSTGNAYSDVTFRPVVWN